MSQQMSTNISDLPDPEEIEEEIYEDRHRDQESIQRPIQHINYQNHEKPIKMNIKKSSESRSVFDSIRNEVTEENFLIFVIIFLATSHYTDTKILSLLSFNNILNTSSSTITLMKCVLLLLLFIIVKNYLLPYIKV